LTADEVDAVLVGRSIHREDDEGAAPETGRRSSVPQSGASHDQGDGTAQPENA